MTRDSAYWIRRLTVLLAVLWSCSVHAANDAEYKTHYDRAHELVRSGDRHGAIREFEAAYAASPRPEALYNVGMLYRKLAQDGGTAEEAQRAVDYFEQYIERYHEDHGVNAPDGKTVTRYASELRSAFHLAEAVTPQKPLPVVETPRPAPRPRTVNHLPPAVPAADAPDTTDSPDSDTTPPEPRAAYHKRVPQPAPNTAAPDEKPKRSRTRLIVGGVLIAVGVIAAGTGGSLAGLSFSQADGDKLGTLDNYTSSISSLNTERGAGVALAIVGAAGIIAGAVTLALPSRPDQAVSISVAPSFGGLCAAGTF